jgi:hypothetical protein
VRCWREKVKPSGIRTWKTVRGPPGQHRPEAILIEQGCLADIAPQSETRYKSRRKECAYADQELQTAQRLQKAGLSAEASAVIAEKLEEAASLAQATAFDRFRAELRSEMGALRLEVGALRLEVGEKIGEVRVEVAKTRADLEHSMRVMQTVLLSAIALAVAILAGAPALLARFLSH